MKRRLVIFGGVVLAMAWLTADHLALADGNNTIRLPDASTVAYDTSLAIDVHGNPVVSYIDVRWRLKLLHCDDPSCDGDGESITFPDIADGAESNPALVLDASGNPVVSYVNDGNLKLLHCGDPNCAGTDKTIALPDTVECCGNGVGFDSSIVLDAQANPVVSYNAGYPYYDLRLLHCGNPACTLGNIITSPDTVGDVGLYTSLRLDASGFPVVSYYDATNGRLKVMHCHDANCDRNDESVTSPDNEVSGGEYDSLALDSSGNPVVSYYSPVAPHVRVLHCNDPNCSGGDESITGHEDIGLLVGQYTSLALDARGNPIVAYDGISGLTIMLCNDPNCTGDGENVTSVDVSGFIQHTSIALDVVGNPIVSYNGGGWSWLPPHAVGLKVLHCGSPACVGKGVGDINCDNAADARDSAILLQYAAGLLDVFGCSHSADVNEDGLVNSLDALLILQYANRMIGSLPV